MKNILGTTESNFIENYEIIGSKIKVNLSNDKSFFVTYTKGYERMLLKKMSHQAKNIVKQEGTIKTYSYLYYIVSIIFAITLLPILTCNTGIIAILALVLQTLNFACVFTISHFSHKYLHIIEKMKLVLESEEFNKNIDNKKIETDVSLDTYLRLEDAKDNKKELNINFLDGLSLEDLKQMKENISQYLPKEQPEIEDEEIDKKFTLVK